MIRQIATLPSGSGVGPGGCGEAPFNFLKGDM